MWRIYLYIFLIIASGLGDAYASCSKENACTQEGEIELAQQTSLPPAMVAMLQQQFGGRVVGVTPKTANPSAGCQQFNKTIIIDGQPQQAYGTACPQGDGAWRTDNLLDVQLLKENGRVVIITVNPATQAIINVQK